jgi:hypothetical protein
VISASERCGLARPASTMFKEPSSENSLFVFWKIQDLNVTLPRSG